MYFSNFLHLQGTFVASTKINRSTTAFHTFKYVIQSCIHARTLTRSPNVDAKGTNLVSRLLYACHELDRIADRLDGRYFHTKIEQSTIQTLHCFSHHNTLQSFSAVQSVIVAKRNCKTKSMTRVGFEPTPMKTTALTLRLRPLGHRVFAVIDVSININDYSLSDSIVRVHLPPLEKGNPPKLLE